MLKSFLGGKLEFIRRKTRVLCGETFSKLPRYFLTVREKVFNDWKKVNETTASDAKKLLKTRNKTHNGKKNFGSLTLLNAPQTADALRRLENSDFIHFFASKFTP